MAAFHPQKRRTPENAGAAAPVDPDQLLLVGRIWRPHGVRGELKVIPETDDPERLQALDTVYVGSSLERAVPQAVASLRFQPTKRGVVVVLGLEAVADREAADLLRKQEVYALEDDLPPLAEDELFIHDLIDLDVVDEEGHRIGTVKDVLPTPAHDVYVVAREGQRDAMIPAVEAFITEIDLEAGAVRVRLIEGLL